MLKLGHFRWRLFDELEHTLDDACITIIGMMEVGSHYDAMADMELREELSEG